MAPHLYVNQALAVLGKGWAQVAPPLKAPQSVK